MKIFLSNVKRNTKLFFKDKGLFFTSLITPIILLVLYSTFLSSVYSSSIEQQLSGFGIKLEQKYLSAIVSGQLMSSLLAVSCVTVSFCSNMLMVQDKISGAHKDLLLTPVKRSNLALSYYVSTTISTLIICLAALCACLIYVASVGWFLSFADVMLLLLDIFLLVTFGTALSSVVNFFLSSQGQVSAVGSMISSCYGFISGAYMPLSTFSSGLRSALMFLPGTYGTSLLRNHSINSAIDALSSSLPQEAMPALTSLKDAIDCNLYFFGSKVEVSAMYLVLGLSIVALITAYVLINKFCKNTKK